MRFAVLGSLEVADDHGEPVVLSSARQRGLLAILLCHANQVVSVDSLIDQLWSGDPPKSARTNLQVYVHRLRQVLGGERILLQPPGYQLVARPGELDAQEFEDLVAAGQPAEALRLWRGDAYAGLTEIEPLATEAARLDELRLVALEDRIEADLDAGRQVALVAELTKLTARHPLREGFRAQLMLALHRSGRGVEALEVYRDTRQALIDELGVEPGARLRELERAILNDDPSLHQPAAAPADTGAGAAEPASTGYKVVVPAELPAATTTFTGRHPETGKLTALLTKRNAAPAVIAIAGPGGGGKSALALHVAQAVAADFPDGQLYVNLHGATPGVPPMKPHDVLARFLRALGFEDSRIPADPDEAAARFRSLTAGRRLLVVLDDVASAEQVRPLLPGGSDSAVLITSRTVLATLDGAHHVHLGALSDDEAVVLLARLAGTERVAQQGEAAEAIVRLCDGLPLAIRIAGARLAARPDLSLRTLADRLSDTRHRLDELEHADFAIRSSFAVSKQELTPDGAALFVLLGLLDLPFVTVPAAAALADRTSNQAERDLECLVEAQLVQPDSNQRYVLHDLIRLYARELARQGLDEAEQDRAIRRTLHCGIATARRAIQLLDPGTEARTKIGTDAGVLTRPGLKLEDRQAALDWFDRERDILAAVFRIPDLPVGYASELAALAAALRPLFHTAGRWMDLAAINQTVLRTAGHGCPELTALAHRDLGSAYGELGRYDEAMVHLRKSAEEWTELDHPAGQATALDAMANVEAELGDHERAIPLYDQALSINRALGKRDSEARVLNNLGMAYLNTSRFDQARSTFEASLAIRRELGDARGIGITIGNLAWTWLRAGSPEQALPAFEEALLLYREFGLRFPEAKLLWAFGEALEACGHGEPARQRWRQAVDILTELGPMSKEEAEHVLAEPLARKPDVLR
ncbi:AfsR/SARP family transcriptional regulator [Flindersiella endophytica]